ncbi:PQQ-dependent sugar dehydrogenase [Patescibacteria group bacterium]|nr:PQQ-dependent sugar dehydrogenase [Patescibacteria group bacterium]
MKKTILALGVVLGIALVLYGVRGQLLPFLFSPQAPSKAQTGIERVPEEAIAMIAQGLTIPWEVAFLPNKDILVTQRSGELLLLGEDAVYEIEGVAHVGEGGLLGMALHPDFETSRWLYLYLTTQTEQGLENRVERYRFEENKLSERTLLLSGIPGARFHDGGRIEFGPDGMLYITTGDAGNPDSAQDIHSLSGKILRLNDDGSIPDDNPFLNEVYSYGHRNPQGLTWDNKGRLWSTEHGRSGLQPGQSGFDELNLIEKGKNYGWPVIQGGETKEGMEAPFVHSGADFTWAPGDVEYIKGNFFFGGLRGEALYQVTKNSKELKAHFFKEFGRIRAVRLAPDGMLYITTSNQDGRGRPKEGDDKIIRLDPSLFEF